MLSDYKIHQICHYTKFNRYPGIFSKCASLREGKLRILSFGCSAGAECVTLQEYFPEAEITGVEINQKCLKWARENYDFNFVEETPNQFFDLIFCMSVLCREVPTIDLQDCTGYYSFKQFENQVAALIDKLAYGGCLIIFNSNFRFSDTDFYEQFQPVPVDIQYQGAIAKTFGKNHKRCEPYKEYVFLRC